MTFWISWRCSHAFLTSMSFNRAKVPMVRCSLAGFWKMLSSTPWSYNWTTTTTCWNDLVLSSKWVFGCWIDTHKWRIQHLCVLLQHLFFKFQKSFLNFGIIQREWQEVRERLLFPETLNKDLNSCDCWWHCSLVGTCDNCQTKEEIWDGIFWFPISLSNLFRNALNPHQSVLPLLVLGCW